MVFGALIRWNEKLLVERITPTIIEEIDDENAREAAQKLVEERITLFGKYFLFQKFYFKTTRVEVILQIANQLHLIRKIINSIHFRPPLVCGCVQFHR